MTDTSSCQDRQPLIINARFGGAGGQHILRSSRYFFREGKLASWPASHHPPSKTARPPAAGPVPVGERLVSYTPTKTARPPAAGPVPVGERLVSYTPTKTARPPAAGPVPVGERLVSYTPTKTARPPAAGPVPVGERLVSYHHTNAPPSVESQAGRHTGAWPRPKHTAVCFARGRTTRIPHRINPASTRRLVADVLARPPITGLRGLAVGICLNDSLIPVSSASAVPEACPALHRAPLPPDVSAGCQ